MIERAQAREWTIQGYGIKEDLSFSPYAILCPIWEHIPNIPGNLNRMELKKT
jgi:hypothetical protein